MMAYGYDPDAETANIHDPVSRRQARLMYEGFNRIWGLKPPPTKDDVKSSS